MSGSSHRNNQAGMFMNTRFRYKQLLDNEALSCLLILLFVDEPKLNVARLHRILRNLSNNSPTRKWIIHSLLSIMEKSSEVKSYFNSNQSGPDLYSNLKNKRIQPNFNNSINRYV